MATAPVQLDFSKAQPINPPAQQSAGVSLDFSKAQPIGASAQAATAATPPEQASQPTGVSGTGNTTGNETLDKVLTGINDLNEFPANVGKGFIKGVGDTVTGVAGLLHKARQIAHPGEEDTLIPEQGVNALDQASEAHGFSEGTGKVLENIAEFMLGDEALKSLSMTQKLSKILPQLKAIEKSPRLVQWFARHLPTAVRQGVVAGGQGLAKGEDLGTAAEQGLITGGTGLAIEGAASGVKSLLRGGSKAAETGAGAYAEQAKGAIRPHLEAVQEAAGKVEIPKLNVEDAINKTGDYTGARANLADQLNAVNDHLETATGGKFLALRDEVSAAQRAAWKGGAEEAAAYKSKIRELDDLLSQSKLPPELNQAVRGGWRQYYVLGDVAKSFDKALDGIPGESAVSQAQRGINGGKLMRSLQNTVIVHGRAAVENALGGAERLKALEMIANANKTNASRTAFNKALWVVGQALPAGLGAKMGWALTGNWVGAAAGAEAGRETARMGMTQVAKVLQAVKTNPRIAQNLIFAIESGARPQNYGPMIATMVQQYFKEQQNAQGREEENQPEDTEQ